MCHYCGCRDIPLIKEFIAEHEAVTDLGGDAVRALGTGDRARAALLAAEMAVLLRRHWAGEEAGLFRVMAENEEYAGYVAALASEHRALDAFLTGLDLEDAAQRAAFAAAVDELHHHIAKEEDGLFPASLTELTGPQWNEAMTAWSEVHGRPVAPAGAGDGAA
ncbi:hemerythrin domain-containing protein [Streptomyces sp. NPDC058052]|uniref:hemerythrin domain-containing protein n=1 Tax=Streptomyces sp. NPDC058052 TaxID=3346316 RepID=UPI0036E9E57D